MTRHEWRRAYRAARLLPHKNACAHAVNQLEGERLFDAFRLALRLRTSHVWRCGIECAKQARANGRSFSKAIELNLRAVQHRTRTTYDPYHKRFRREV